MSEPAPRLIVRVLWGPLGGRKATLAPGEALRIGRGERADLVVPGDAGMAALHLELGWDGQRCCFRDLNTAGGTIVNGEAGRREGEIHHGGWLRAGDTIFTVHVEGRTPPPPSRDDDAERLRRVRAEEALVALETAAAAEPLHAVLDAARDKRILTLCAEAVEEHHSLYDGQKGEDLAAVAPHLVRLRPGSRLLTALVREGFGKRWGIWLTSRAQPRELRRHLRRFLMVEREGEPGRVYFRYYDPATLAAFLPTCTPRQAEELHASVSAFWAETRGGALRCFPSPAPTAESRAG